MKRWLKTERKALRLAIFAVVSTHEQTNFYRTAIAAVGRLPSRERLVPDPHNARTHPRRQIEQIMASIEPSASPIRS